MGRNGSQIGKAWLKKETRPYGAFVLFLTLLTTFTTLFSLAFAYLVRYLINSATAGETSFFWVFAAVLLGVLLFKILLKTLGGYLSERLRAKMYTELRQKAFARLLRSDYSGVQAYHSGELLNRLTSDAQEVAVDTVGFLPAVAGMLVQLVGALVALFTIDPLFTGIYIVCGAVFGGLTVLFRRKIKRLHKEVRETDGETRSFMQEGVSSVMTLKAYGAEEKTAEKSRILSEKYYKKRMNRNVLRTEMNFVFSLLSNCGLIFAVVWCGFSLLNGDGSNDYGKILSVVLLLMQLQQPLTSFASVLPVYYSRIASAERLAELEAIPTETTSEEDGALYERLEKIRFASVDFTYGRAIVLSGVNATVEKGEIVCLTGASGSGKSTLFKLLLSVYSPTGGDIFIDGEEGSRRLDAKARGLFAYVPQGNFLFSGTIYENLTFFTGEEKASEEKLKDALRCACAEFVYDLPDGLDTVLTENGQGLSEGQRQRLAVARALLSERPVLLLDEATSALDGETEKALLENIKRLENKTCLIVTHRPQALEIADRVLVLENGRIRTADEK